VTVIRFGEWLPDLAPLGNPGLIEATNVVPSATGYLPMRGLVAVTDALDDRPLGAIQALDSDRNVFQYAGDMTKLYQNVGGSWTDRSKSGGYATPGEQAWEFVAWKDKVLATNFGNFPQQIVLGDTAFTDLTTDFRARHIAVIRDFVAVADTTDAVDGHVTSRTRWSGIGDELDWTVSAETLADFQDLRTQKIERLFGGEFGVVLQRNAVWRMTFVGAPVVFQFDEVLKGIGLLAELDTDYLHRITASPDPTAQRIWWAYAGPGNVGGTPNRVAIYDRTLDRWTLRDLGTAGIELLWQSGTTGLTLEQLDTISTSLDALPASLDASRWLGGAPVLAAFDAQYRSGFFTGPKATATLETGDREIHSGHRTRLDAWRALVDGGTVRSRVSTRNRQTDPIVVGAYRDQSASGRFTQRANARYHRFGVEITGDWEHALGVQVEPVEARRGERRG